MIKNDLVCRICGGEMSPNMEQTSCSCLSCGAGSMLPKSDIKTLNRITYLRNEFDFEGAKKLADKLVKDNPEDSEAYWSRLLCTYGIQYIKNTGKRFPVCRADVTPLPELTEADDYKHALYYATEEMQSEYTTMGQALADSVNIARGILAQPQSYDIFVLSGEESSSDNDEDGSKLYLRFTENLGFNVFYMPESLKEMDEPEKGARILGALKNSTMMIVLFRDMDDCRSGMVGYGLDIFGEAVKADSEKKLMTAFNSHKVSFQNLPEPLVWLDEAFDSSEDEFRREISDAVEKLLKPETASIAPDTIVTATAANKENLIKRAYMFLEDGEFETADTYFDKILDIDIEDSRAYIGKLLAEYKLTSEDKIPELPHPITDDKNYIKAIRFATPEQKGRYESLNAKIVDYIESEKKRISEERDRLRAEREEKEAIERQRRERQMKEERKMEYQRRKEPLRKTLAEVNAELSKALLSPAKRKKLEEDKKVLEKNLKELEGLFPDIWD